MLRCYSKEGELCKFTWLLRGRGPAVLASFFRASSPAPGPRPHDCRWSGRDVSAQMQQSCQEWHKPYLTSLAAIICVRPDSRGTREAMAACLLLCSRLAAAAAASAVDG